MKVLVLNCGSSSIKYQFIDTVRQSWLAKGMVERIGMTGAVLTHYRFDGDDIKIVGEILDHSMAIEYVLGVLLSKNHGVIDLKEDIDAETYDEAIKIIMVRIKRPTQSMFGRLKQVKAEFKREEVDRF